MIVTYIFFRLETQTVLIGTGKMGNLFKYAFTTKVTDGLFSFYEVCHYTNSDYNVKVLSFQSLSSLLVFPLTSSIYHAVGFFGCRAETSQVWVREIII